VTEYPVAAVAAEGDGWATLFRDVSDSLLAIVTKMFAPSNRTDLGEMAAEPAPVKRPMPERWVARG